MTYKVQISAGGKIVIPAALRRELGLAAGDMLALGREGESVVPKSRKQVLREVQAAFRAAVKRPFTVDEFLAERREGATHE